MKENKPKILYLDYETSMNEGKFYGSIWETRIVKIIKFFKITSGSYNWEGEKRVYSIGQDDFKGYKKGVFNDKEICKFFAKLCEEADYIVAQNGDAFDIKVLNTRLLAHRIPPVPKTKTFDTKKLSKGVFRFPSNSLKHIAEFLGIESKGDINMVEITDRCEQGDKKAWKELKKYGKLDTIILKKIFHIILPYCKLPAMFNKTDLERPKCRNPLCLSTDIQLRGFENRADSRKLQRYVCKVCGKWGSILLKKTKK